MVVRRDAGVSLMGVQAELPPDLSPLTIGTRGVYGGQGFILVGRVRQTYDAGAWTEWCADFGHDRWGWVAEAQGLYYASEEIAVPADFPGKAEIEAARGGVGDGIVLVDFEQTVGRAQMVLGRTLRIAGRSYAVSDVKTATVRGAEGELTFAATPGRTALSVDLRGDDGAFASAEYSKDGIRLFVGRILSFEDLKFTELRQVPGWTAEVQTVRGQTQALACPKCAAVVELRAVGFSMSAVCGNCGSILDAADPTLRVIEEAGRSEIFKPLIPLGTRGRFGEVDFECIGFLRRRDHYGESWSEYLLFNPFVGYRWLVTYQGHWSWVELLASEPRQVGGRPIWRGKPHALFAVARTQVTYVLGEFYWRVRRGEASTLRDFIAPPWVVSEESYPDLAEKTWSAGEYLPSTAVRAAFRLAQPLPEPSGPYLNEPNPHRDKGRTLRWLFPLMAILVLLIQCVLAAGRARQAVYASPLEYRPGEINLVHTTPVFEIPGRRSQALEFQLQAPVENQWLEVNMDLVHATTKRVRELTIGVEFYQGFDDGHWSEGSQVSQAVLPAVEPGTYYLVIRAVADPAVGAMDYQLRVTRDVTLWSNLWLGWVLLAGYPIFRWVREHAFERRRWSQSDFQPNGSVVEVEEED